MIGRPSRRGGSIAIAAGVWLLLLATAPARSETPEAWVALGTRVHGGFGTFIPLGIRIGEDALRRLEVARRDVTVIYSNGAAPCPCVADGIAIATEASVGQGTLRVTQERSPPDTLGVAVIQDKKSGRGLRYVVPASLLPQLLQWNKDKDPLGRYHAVMDAPEPYSVTEVQAESAAH